MKAAGSGGELGRGDDDLPAATTTVGGRFSAEDGGGGGCSLGRPWLEWIWAGQLYRRLATVTATTERWRQLRRARAAVALVFLFVFLFLDFYFFSRFFLFACGRLKRSYAKIRFSHAVALATCADRDLYRRFHACGLANRMRKSFSSAWKDLFYSSGLCT